MESHCHCKRLALLFSALVTALLACPLPAWPQDCGPGKSSGGGTTYKHIETLRGCLAAVKAGSRNVVLTVKRDNGTVWKMDCPFGGLDCSGMDPGDDRLSDLAKPKYLNRLVTVRHCLAKNARTDWFLAVLLEFTGGSSKSCGGGTADEEQSSAEGIAPRGRPADRYPRSVFVLRSVGVSGGSGDWQLLSFPSAALEGREFRLESGAAVEIAVPAFDNVLEAGLVSGCQACKWRLEAFGSEGLIDSWSAYSEVVPRDLSLIIRGNEWAQASVGLGAAMPRLDLASRAGLEPKFRPVSDPERLRTIRVTLVHDAGGSTAFRLFMLGRD